MDEDDNNPQMNTPENTDREEGASESVNRTTTDAEGNEIGGAGGSVGEEKKSSTDQRDSETFNQDDDPLGYDSLP